MIFENSPLLNLLFKSLVTRRILDINCVYYYIRNLNYVNSFSHTLYYSIMTWKKPMLTKIKMQ